MLRSKWSRAGRFWRDYEETETDISKLKTTLKAHISRQLVSIDDGTKQH